MQVRGSSQVKPIDRKHALEAGATCIDGDLFTNDDGAILIPVHIEAPGQVLELVGAGAGLRPDSHAYVAASGRRVVVQDFRPVAVPQVEALVHYFTARHELDPPESYNRQVWHR